MCKGLEIAHLLPSGFVDAGGEDAILVPPLAVEGAEGLGESAGGSRLVSPRDHQDSLVGQRA